MNSRMTHGRRGISQAALAGVVFGDDVVELGAMDEEEAEEAVRTQLRAVYGTGIVGFTFTHDARLADTSSCS